MIELLDCESVPESLESVNETPESVSESPENVNDSSESVPGSTEPEEMEQDEPSSSDWENASGDEEHPEENEVPDESEKIDGDPLSIRGPDFGQIISTADNVLNNLVSMLHEKKQRDGEMTIKIGFEDTDGLGSYIFSGSVSGKINYSVKPQKVIGDAVRLQFDDYGRPILPADREKQLTFDDVSQNDSAGTTITTDQNMVVESVTPDDISDLDDSESTEKDSEECEQFFCPFYHPDCTHSCDQSDFENNPDMVRDAVESEGCQNPDLLKIYNMISKEDINNE
jgi:hypothetical protein